MGHFIHGEKKNIMTFDCSLFFVLSVGKTFKTNGWWGISVQFSRSLMTIVTIYCIFCLQSYQKFLLWLYRQRRIRESIWTWWLHRNFLNRWGNRQDHLSLADKHTFCIKSISQSMWRRGHQRPQNHRIYLEKGNKGGTNLYLQLPHPTSGVAPERTSHQQHFRPMR